MRFRYEETDESQESIAGDYAIHRKTLDRIAKDEGWTLRKNRLPHDVPPALRIEAEAEQALRQREQMLFEDPPAAGDNEASSSASGRRERELRVAEALERAIEKEVAAVARTQALLGQRPKQAADAEKMARTLTSLTGALQKIRRLRCPDAATADQPAEIQDELPADIDEFRRALARRIEAFVRSRRHGRVSEGGDALSAEPTES